MTGHDPATLHELARAVIEQATARRLTIATVESCTGGLVASLLTDVPGASAVYRGGWVPYHDNLKRGVLGVPAPLIAAEGAVSRPVAEALARGGRQQAESDVAVATTGILGPSGGTSTKPVGTLWLAVATSDDVRSVQRLYHGDRAANKGAFAREALLLLRDVL